MATPDENPVPTAGTSPTWVAARAAARTRTGPAGGPGLAGADRGADAASHVWAHDYAELRALLADETIAPDKRIASAAAWITETIR